jgi:phage terminase large subunit-like protein
MWAENPKAIIHLVGPTTDAARNVMVEGPSGLLQCYPPERRPVYEPSRHQITFPSGAIGRTFTAEEPERLRGPQCLHYWADEPCAWRFLQDAWDNLMFGFRIGDDPRGIVTTTPKPSAWLREMLASPDTVSTRHSTYENRGWLAPAFFNAIIKRYEGTRLGRQELLAEVLSDVPGALWKQAMIDATRVRLDQVRWDLITRIVIPVDPAVTANERSDETGIVPVALLRSGHVLVLDDLSCKASPLDWARIVSGYYYSHRADRVVGEVNNGGDLVEANIRAVAPNISFRAVHASRGKYKRAEPVAALYEQGRVHHVGLLADLEQQMCSFVPGDDSSNEGTNKDDRMDSLVWGITELLIDPEPMTVEMSYGLQQISPW